MYNNELLCELQMFVAGAWQQREKILVIVKSLPNTIGPSVRVNG